MAHEEDLNGLVTDEDLQHLRESAELVNYRLEVDGGIMRLFDEAGNLLIDSTDPAEVGVLIDDEMQRTGMFDEDESDAMMELHQGQQTLH